jgi:type IV pilus assembly protein PilP
MMIRTEVLKMARFCPLLLVVLASGCVWVEGTDDLKQYTEEQKAKPSGRIEPLPEFKAYESFVYEGSSLRDPFKPLAQISANDIEYEDQDALKPDMERDREYLETFSLDVLDMVGTITHTGDAGIWALIKDPNAEVHQVSVGDYLGNDYGQIVSVSERKLDLVEIISNGRGGWMKRPRTLSLEVQD